MDHLSIYLPHDRRLALARNETLPDRATGAALFADIAGFTSLTEKLTRQFGPRRGIDELTQHINRVYEALIGEVDRFGGSVISFAGDAVTCWFDAGAEAPSARAVLCAQAMQTSMEQFPDLSIKIAVSSGAVRRFATGDPEMQRIDVIAGAAVARLATAEQLATAGEIIVDSSTIVVLQTDARETRRAGTGEYFFVLHPPVEINHRQAIPTDFVANAQEMQLDAAVLKPWVLPIVYQGKSTGYGLFLTELRPTVAVFMRFMGIDYDNDEQAQEKLDTIVSLAQRVFARHGGTLLQLIIGDKGSYLYASFGAIQIHEDDAHRAVRACLELRQLFRDIAFLESIQFGLSSGTMRVGAYGSHSHKVFGALGDDVNLAARLMTTAAPGEILVSGRIQKAIAQEFLLDARPPIRLKGKAEPLPVFAVAGLRQYRAIRLQEPSYALPMTGREHEMRVLGEKLASALHGQGQIIGITAEAGMGKSRLVAEGIRLARRSNLTGYGGTCQADSVNTPYLVWNAIWNAFFDLDPTLPLRKQIRALENELQDRTPEHIDALPLLGAVLGLALPDNDYTRALQPKDRKAQLETVLVKCFESAAREAAQEAGGLLLVLEDLHRIDAVSFDLLELLAQAVENLPVLVMLTYRPPTADSLHPALTRLEAYAHFTPIKLTELNAAETEQAIRAKLAQLYPERGGAVPQLLITRITERAQGNPFYMEELLNYWHDRGIDPREAGALNEFDLPTSLHSLILSRIDQLAVSQQLTLKVASIIGRIFRVDDLHNYYPPLGTAEELKQDLYELSRVELTLPEASEPEWTYVFKHLVTHEVAYESLAYATRAQLHGQYARYLESTNPERTDQLAPLLAHHFEQAQVPDKACFYLGKAGEQAAADYANDEALVYFNRTLELMTGAETRARFDILLKRERVYDLLGKRAAQRQDLAELARLATHFDDAPFLRAQIAIRQVQLEIDVSNYTAATIAAAAAIQEIKGNADTRVAIPDRLVDALLLQARAMFLAGQVGAAKPELENALAMARAHHYVRGEYNAIAQLGLWSWYGGDYAAAAAQLEQSLELIRQAGDIRRELEILNNLGIVTKDMYQFSTARDYYERAQHIAKKIGDRSGEATLLNNIGRVSFLAGDFERANLYFAQAAALAAQVFEPTAQGVALFNQSEAYRELGQYAAAKNTATEALALVRAAQYRVGEAGVLENIARIEFALGERARALEFAQNALTISREVASTSLEAHILIHIGLMQLDGKEIERAEKSFLDAYNLEKELAEPIPTYEVCAGLAGAALERGDTQSLEQAQTQVQALVHEILSEPQTEQSHYFPMWLYRMCIHILETCRDPRAAQLVSRANAELQARSEKISAPALKRSYLDIREHQAISTFASAIRHGPHADSQRSMP